MSKSVFPTILDVAKAHHKNSGHPLRIVFDGRPAFENLAGIGRYTRQMLLDIEASKIDCECFVLVKNVHPDTPVKPEMLKKCIPVQANLRGFQWHLLSLLNPIGKPFDLYYSPSSLIVSAFARFPTCITIHDLSVLKVPKTQSKKTLLIERMLLGRAIRKTDCIIVPSHSTKQDILDYFQKTDEKKIRIISEEPAREFSPRPKDDPMMASVLTKYDVGYKKFFLSVGTIEPRKNYPTLLKAFALYQKQGGKKKLLIVGKKGWKYQETFETARKLALGDSAQIVETVSFQELPYLYSATACTLCLSLYEGFGLPAAEAIACGSPLIASNNSSFPEVVGDKGILVNPRNHEGIAEALLNIDTIIIPINTQPSYITPRVVVPSLRRDPGEF